MDIEKSYKLAVALGYNEYSGCNVNYDDLGGMTFWWNGLRIPLERVHAVKYDVRLSGRYPWYVILAKEKGIDIKEYGL